MYDLLPIRTAPHTLYHVSPKLFDFPSCAAIMAARDSSPWHANGVLGLWCSTRPVMCGAFGKEVYRVEMKSEARVRGITLDQLHENTSDCTDFRQQIEWLCPRADILYVVDGWPLVGEVIVLNMDMINRFERVTELNNRDHEAELSVDL